MLPRRLHLGRKHGVGQRSMAAVLERQRGRFEVRDVTSVVEREVDRVTACALSGGRLVLALSYKVMLDWLQHLGSRAHGR